MSKKNGRIMMACYFNTVDEPCCEIPHAPHIFSLAAIFTDTHFIARKNLIISMDILVVEY